MRRFPWGKVIMAVGTIMAVLVEHLLDHRR
jgi:hypothetical protein